MNKRMPTSILRGSCLGVHGSFYLSDVSWCHTDRTGQWYMCWTLCLALRVFWVLTWWRVKVPFGSLLGILIWSQTYL